MNRRGFIAAGGALGLAGCVTASPVAGPEALAAFRIVGMRVEAGEALREAENPIALPEAQVERIIRDTALGVVRAVRDDGTRPVTVDVLVMRLFVPTVASAAIAARGAAAMDASIQVRDARTGAPIGGPRGLRAYGQTRLGGLIGAAITAQALQQNGTAGEIELAARALGGRIAEVVYGIEPA